jgi:hypothetical protein
MQNYLQGLGYDCPCGHTSGFPITRKGKKVFIMEETTRDCTYSTLALEGTFELLSPLSHIGEAISVDTYLSEEPIYQSDGSVVPVFSYSGNALRGQLRDHAAVDYLSRLGMKVSLKPFHLLFSGGCIHGDQKIDLAWRRKFRYSCPPGSLFGGGIGSGMIEGKCCIGISYPRCKETARILGIDEPSSLPPYGQLTVEKSYTRSNDAKKDKLAEKYLEGPAELPEEKKKDEASQQMRFTSELLAAGTVLNNCMTLTQCSWEEMGAFVAAFTAFHNEPYLGGQRARGHGACRFRVSSPDGTFLIEGGQGVKELTLSPLAQESLHAYRARLEELDLEKLRSFLEEVK